MRAGTGEVKVTFADGSHKERYVEFALGHPTYPMSTERLRQKLEDCLGYAGLANPAAKSARLMDAVLNLESMKDVRELAGVLN